MSYLLDALKQSQQSDMSAEHYDLHSEQLKQQPLVKLGGLRCLYFEATVADGMLYINGEQIQLGKTKESLIALLCDSQQLTLEALTPWLTDDETLNQLTDWVNAGYWYFDDIE